MSSKRSTWAGRLLAFMVLAIAIAAFAAGPSDAAPNPAKAADKIGKLTEAGKKSLAVWSLTEINSASQPFCWKQSYGRGAGDPMTCAAPLEKDGALCYDKCKDGYGGAGPMCWEHCPSGYHDDGATCRKDPHVVGKPSAYGRGAGYAIWDEKKCNREHSQGCEKDGAMYYPRCKPGFHKVGCCICSPDCPAGYHDDGATCRLPGDIKGKKSYGRGAGSALSACASNEEKDGALCYPKCKSGYYGVGPVCWQDCPSTQSSKCGAACASDASQCGENIANMVLSVAQLAANIVGLVTTGGAADEAAMAAKSAAKTAAKEAAKEGAKEAAKAAAKTAAKDALKKLAKSAMAKVRKIVAERLTKKYAKELAEEIMENVAFTLAVQAAADDPDIKDILESLDPTGVADVVEAFNKPKCSLYEDAPTAH